MLHDRHLRVLYYNPNGAEVFPTTDIKGGVVVTIRNENKDYGEIGVFTAFPELNSILKKIKGEPSLSDTVSKGVPYAYTEDLLRDYPDIIDLTGTSFDVRTNSFAKLDNIIFMEKPGDESDYVEIIGLLNGKRTSRFIKRAYLKTPDNFEFYKVFVPKANGSGALGEVLSTPLIGLPLIGHTQSFISIGRFDTEEEAQACMKYIKSKFARVLLGVLKVTQDNPAPKWKYVPLQDFTSSSDIDWSQSVAEIDAQLYRKYGLSPEEIDFIETKVKEMD